MLFKTLNPRRSEEGGTLQLLNMNTKLETLQLNFFFLPPSQVFGMSNHFVCSSFFQTTVRHGVPNMCTEECSSLLTRIDEVRKALNAKIIIKRSIKSTTLCSYSCSRNPRRWRCRRSFKITAIRRSKAFSGALERVLASNRNLASYTAGKLQAFTKQKFGTPKTIAASFNEAKFLREQ